MKQEGEEGVERGVGGGASVGPGSTSCVPYLYIFAQKRDCMAPFVVILAQVVHSIHQFSSLACFTPFVAVWLY